MPEKTVFIIPGYSHSTEESNYQKIGEFYREENFETVFIELDWSDKFEVNLENARQKIRDEIKRLETPEVHFFGHS